MSVNASVPNLGRRQRLFGWSLMLAGIVYGELLGTFVFDGPLASPERFADYGSLPRRLIRFAHIAWMALGILNVLYGHEIDGVPLSVRWRRVGSISMQVAGALMPVCLTLAAFEISWKWALPIPATAAFVAVAVLVAGLSRRTS